MAENDETMIGRMHDALDELVIPPTASIRDAMAAIDRGAERICCVVDAARVLLGVVTDGDVRRGLLGGAGLEDPVDPLVVRRPVVASPQDSRVAVLELMNARGLAEVPVVDDSGRLVGLHSIKRLLGRIERPNAALVFAGGRGSRLGSLTDALPKPMMPVAGRPILERIVLHLTGAGITRIFLAVNYLADVIEDHFGDGSDLGCSITYLREDPERPLGPGGALSLLAQEVDPATLEPLIAMNGDVVTDIDVVGLLEHHERQGAIATVSATSHAHEVPFGVLDIGSEGHLRGFVEKPRVAWDVNAGVYVLDPSLLGRVPPEREYTIPALLVEAIGQGETVAVWVHNGDWIDVGRPADLHRARGDTA